MGKEYKQITLDETYIATEMSKKCMADLLNQYPNKNIAIVERGIGVDTSYRPQIRFYSKKKSTIEFVKGVLKLSTRVKPLKKDGWQIQVTRPSKVRWLLQLLFPKLSLESQKRAMLVIDSIIENEKVVKECQRL